MNEPLDDVDQAVDNDAEAQWFISLKLMPSNPHYTQVTLLKIGATFCQFLKTTTKCSKLSKTFPPPTRHKKICSNFTSTISKKSKFWIFQFWHVRHCPNDPKLWKEPWGAYRVPKICSNFTPHQLLKIQIWNFSILTGASLAKWTQTFMGTWGGP